MRTITIIVHDDNYFDVHEGERVAPGLIWDELLGEVARLTQTQNPADSGRYMTSIDLHVERMLRHRRLARAPKTDPVSPGE